MAKIIRFPKSNLNKGPENLDEALARASFLFKEDLPELKERFMVVSSGKMRQILETLILKVLMQNKMIEVSYFLCGNYISEVLTSLGSNVPESWFAIDFYTKGNAEAMKQGANLCFILCSLFPKRTNFRTMNFHDYQDMGQGLYLRFYYSTGAEIGYLMSRLFPQMVAVTEQAIGELK